MNWRAILKPDEGYETTSQYSQNREESRGFANSANIANGSGNLQVVHDIPLDELQQIAGSSPLTTEGVHGISLADVRQATKNDLPPDEEARIREWLAGISETDPAMIKETLDRCRADADIHRHFLKRADEVPPPLTADDQANIAEAFEERTAIQEFDGFLTRAESERQARVRVQIYRYRLTGDPARWQAMIACDLDEAIRRANLIFGPDRVLEVRRHRP